MCAISLSKKRKEARKREEASNLGFTCTHAWHDKVIAQECMHASVYSDSQDQVALIISLHDSHCVWRPVRVQNQDAVRFLVYEWGMGCFGPPDSHTLCMASCAHGEIPDIGVKHGRCWSICC